MMNERSDISEGLTYICAHFPTVLGHTKGGEVSDEYLRFQTNGRHFKHFNVKL